MSEARTIILQVREEGERLDRVVADAVPELSRASAQRLIKGGEVTVNGRTSKPSFRVETGDEVVVQVPAEKPREITPEDIPLEVVYEDEHLAAVSKPVNALLNRWPETKEVGGAERAGIVHRLDKDTSGLILVAKNEATHAALQRQFKRRQVKKTYLALVEQHPSPRQGLIDAPIGRGKRERKRMAIVKSGRNSRTAYRAIELFDEHSLVELQPETGRTHQLRVHLAWLGCPVVGDRVYGYRRQRLLKERHFLHAHKLELTHPVTGEGLSLMAPLPGDLANLLRRLRR
jgi:23S rRNA pseudouridine1911/1915/1917 synthase